MKRNGLIIVAVMAVLICAYIFLSDGGDEFTLTPQKIMPYENIYFGMSLEEFEAVKPEGCTRLPNDGEYYRLIDGVHTKLSDIAFYRETIYDENNAVIYRQYHFPINVEYKPEYTDYLDSIHEETVIQYGSKVSEEEMEEFVSMADEYKAAFVEEFSLTDKIINEPYMEY